MITAWDAITVAAVANSTMGIRAHSGSEEKERRGHRALVGQHQRALAEVAQRAGGQHQAQPAEGDRAPAEVAHVGVQRLGAGDGEHDRGEREEGDVEVAADERQRVRRRERPQDLGIVDDAADARTRRSRLNHTIITGPKSRPIVAVPRLCTGNSATMITAVIGTTKSLKSGSMTLRPSTADSTEMAGVIMLSPKNSAAPNSPSAGQQASPCAARCAPVHRRSSVISAMIPPSPWLSARITSVT